MNFKTKPRDEQLSFVTECVRCRGELSINNGRVTPHDCRDNNKTAGELFEEVLAALGK